MQRWKTAEPSASPAHLVSLTLLTLDRLMLGNDQLGCHLVSLSRPAWVHEACLRRSHTQRKSADQNQRPFILPAARLVVVLTPHLGRVDRNFH